MKDMLNREVLLLNLTYEPLGVVTVKHSFELLFRPHKPVVVEKYLEGEYLHSPREKFPVPSVIRLQEYRNPRQRKNRWKKKQIYARDFYRCIYCLKKPPKKKLTLDHVIPRAKGGKTHPSNLVTACFSCNQKKADKSLAEAGMTLRGTIRNIQEETWQLQDLRHFLGKRPEWSPYLV